MARTKPLATEVKAWRAARGISDAMYIYEDQYGWCLAPQTNSPISYVKYWDDFQRTYKTRAEAEAKRSEIWKAEGK